MSVITISRQFGSGGITLGERLARTLAYRLVNEEMIKQVAAKANVSSDGVYAFEKAAGSKLMRFLDRVVKLDYLDRLMSTETGYLNEKRYVRVVTDIINELYEEDNVIIIGRGGQYILSDRPRAYHLLLAADLEHRIQFMVNKYKIMREVAERAIQRGDQQRNLFLKCFSQENHDDPKFYHLAINTAKIGLDEAEKMVLKLIS